mgnify:CR=1 FL=1
MILTLKKLLYLLTPSERKRASLLLIMIILMALLDMIGVASILPFIAVLTNPSLIDTNIILNNLFKSLIFFGVENKQQFLFALGIIVFIILLTSLTFKAFTTYIQIRFVRMREFSIGKKLIENYLRQPYAWFLNRNSADIGKSILSEISTIIGGGIQPMMSLVTQSIVAITFLTLLILVNPKLSLIVFVLFGGSYLIIFKFTQNFIGRIGKERLKANQMRFTSVSEAFGAAKEVKVSGLESYYINLFSKSAKIYAQHLASSTILGQIPRFILEAIAFGGMLLAILYLMAQQGSFTSALPFISLFAFAGYRLIPAFQNIYASITQLRFVGPALDSIYDDLKSLEPINLNLENSKLLFEKEISLKNVFYQYPNSSKEVLKNININIPSKTIVGIIGSTGSGKTTLVDIILGLLDVKKGSLEVDKHLITKKNYRIWQNLIGYVPQDIYLSDDTIASNIAFGIDPHLISLEKVERAAKIAKLHEFVINELPKKYKTIVGERGVRLSGGQRQRIGIARALYNKPKLLILDEGTSALDNETEKVVMDAVYNLNKEITVILIAHRLNTVKKCDRIFLLEEGQLKNEGTFEELIKVNDRLRISVNNS